MLENFKPNSHQEVRPNLEAMQQHNAMIKVPATQIELPREYELYKAVADKEISMDVFPCPHNLNQ